MSKDKAKQLLLRIKKKKIPFSVGWKETGFSLPQPEATSSGHSPGQITVGNSHPGLEEEKHPFPMLPIQAIESSKLEL